jgi:hypothetical protein
VKTIKSRTYLKKLGITIIAAMFLIGVGVGTAVADHHNKDGKIPNLTQVNQDTTDTNGRAARLDIEKETDQLNPVERTIIKRDTLITNEAKSKTNN